MKRAMFGNGPRFFLLAAILVMGVAAGGILGCSGEGNDDSTGVQGVETPVGTSSARIVGTILDLNDADQVHALHLDGTETLGQDPYDAKITQLIGDNALFTEADDGSPHDGDVDISGEETEPDRSVDVTRSEGGKLIATIWIGPKHYVMVYGAHYG